MNPVHKTFLHSNTISNSNDIINALLDDKTDRSNSSQDLTSMLGEEMKNVLEDNGISGTSNKNIEVSQIKELI